MITVKKTWSTAELAPLFRHYPQQTESQNAFLEIDTDHDTAAFDWNAEIGNAVPASVWSGSVRRIPCPNTLSGRQLDTIIEDEDFDKFLIDLFDAYTDYENENRSDAISEAEQALEAYLGSYAEDSTQVYTTEDWMAINLEFIGLDGKRVSPRSGEVRTVGIENYGEITATTTDETIKSLAEQIVSDARNNEAHIYDDAEAYLTSLRNLCANVMVTA